MTPARERFPAKWKPVRRQKARQIKNLVRYLRSGRGATAVEFALIMPSLLMLVLGVFEFGRYLWTVNALQQTVSMTARCVGVLEPYTSHASPGCAASGVYNSADAKSFAEQLAGSYGVTLADSNLTISNSATCSGLGAFSQVQLTYTFNTYLPNVVKAMAAGYTISESACFPNQS